MRVFAVLAVLALAVGGADATAATGTRDVTVHLRANDSAGAPVTGEERLYGASHALVIGIDNYVDGWQRLPNGVADARDVAAEIERRGFTVILKTDTGGRELRETLREFIAIKGADPEAPLLLWATAARAGTPARFALIVGNSQYDELVDLPNPVRDARLISETVRGLGFRVEERRDLGRREMLEAIAAFGRRLGEAGPEAVAFFFYAGHAVQIGGRNFLLPTDTALDRDTLAGGVEMGVVLGTLASAKNGQKFVVLDSCRNNPLDSSPDASRGLAAMKAPPGTLIAYSTAPGRVAFDGAGFNSPYTTALARRLMDSPLPAEELFKEVRAAVMEATGGQQTPWEDSSLIGGDFFFNLARRPRDDSEEAHWDRTKNSGEAEDFQTFLARYPDGTFSGLARRRLAAITGGGTWRGLEEARETSKELAIREAAAESFDMGWVAFKRGRFVDAARWYEKAARFGHAEAGFNLALLYFRGKGVDRDYEASERWARMAADQGFAAAVDFLNVLAVMRPPAGSAGD